MEDNPPRISGKDPRTKNASRPRSSSTNTRFATEQDTGDSFDCSGKQCRSCAASLIADCVAVCCCPLALVSLLALAFVKVPYLVGRRCLRRRKRKRSKKSKKVSEASSGTLDPNLVMSGSFVAGAGRLSLGKSDIVLEFGDDEELEERKSFCAAFEADKVLLELYQVGHLGFGRVSFTGIQSFGKGN